MHRSCAARTVIATSSLYSGFWKEVGTGPALRVALPTEEHTADRSVHGEYLHCHCEICSGDRAVNRVTKQQSFMLKWQSLAISGPFCISSDFFSFPICDILYIIMEVIALAFYCEACLKMRF